MSTRTKTLSFEEILEGGQYVGPLTTLKDAPNNGDIDYVYFSLDGPEGVEYAGVGQIINRPQNVNKHGSETANASLDSVGDVIVTRNDNAAIPYTVHVVDEEESQ